MNNVLLRLCPLRRCGVGLVDPCCDEQVFVSLRPYFHELPAASKEVVNGLLELDQADLFE
ncbi:MAG: hypothetical protein CMJ84_03600 [Planctomycetes bacterium]|nr:hypothetical protein [Planctomycetota bacterium]